MVTLSALLRNWERLNVYSLEKECNVCTSLCVCVFVYFILYKSYGVIVMYNIIYVDAVL